MRAAPGAPKYVILNADESEPGTFSNRKLLEEDPFSTVEAMAIAGLTVGSARGYAYIRGASARPGHTRRGYRRSPSRCPRSGRQ